MMTGCGLLGTDPYTRRALPLNSDPTQLLGGDGTNRSDAISVAMRMRAGLGFGFGQDCMGDAGPAAVVEAFDIRLVACTRVNGEPCAPDQVEFLDGGVPTFQLLKAGEAPNYGVDQPEWAVADKSVSAGPQSEVVRLGDLNSGVTCDAVRNANFGL